MYLTKNKRIQNPSIGNDRSVVPNHKFKCDYLLKLKNSSTVEQQT